MPNTAPIQPVHLDDLVETVVFCLGPEAPSRCVLEIVGPERQALTRKGDKLQNVWFVAVPGAAKAAASQGAGGGYRD